MSQTCMSSIAMAIVEIMGILNFDDDVQFGYTITVLLPPIEICKGRARYLPGRGGIGASFIHDITEQSRPF